jgi:hypothetical protein
VSEEQKKLNKSSDENLKIQQKKLDAIGGQDNILKLQGKTEKDILKIKISQTDETIKAAEISILQAEQTKTSQIEASKRNKQILEGIIMFVTAPLQLLMGAIDLAGKAFGQDFGLREGLTSAVAKFVFDPEKVEKNANESIIKAKEGLDKLKNDRAGFQLAINAIDKTASDKSKADAKTDADDKAKIDEEYRVSQLTAQEKQLEDFAALQKTYLDNGNITQGEYNKKIFDKRKELEGDLQVIGLAASEEFKMMKSDDAFTAIQIKQFEVDEITRIEAEQKVKDRVERQTEASAKLVQAQEFVNKLQRISDMAFSVKFAYMKKGAKDEEAVLRAQFKINKALQLSTAIISAAQAQMTILAQYPKFDGGFAMAAAMVGAALMSAGTIAKIAATQFDTTSAGGNEPPPSLNAGAAAATTNSQPSTLLNPDGTVNNQNTPTPAPIQVYVVESDITSTQTQVAVVQNQMNFH